MNSKERMLAAYRGEKPDRLPISPEIWSATVLDYKKEEFHKYLGPFADKDFVEAWLETQKYFGCDAWILVDLDKPEKGENYEMISDSHYLNSDTIETEVDIKTSKGNLHTVTRTTKEYEFWTFEHPVKNFLHDIPAYMTMALSDPYNSSDKTIVSALEKVGGDGLVSANLGELFISFLAYGRKDDIGQTLLDLHDYEDYIKDLHHKYIKYLCKKVDRLSKIEGLDSIFINNGYSDAGVVGPDLYRKWEIPLLKAIAGKAKKYGFVFHLHQHGKCKQVLNMIADTGVDLVDSLERPSANGDVDDLAVIKNQIGDKIALKGNVDPINVLKNGSKKEVREQVKDCIEAAANNGGYILGTGDSVLEGTPFENIFELVNSGREYGIIY